MIRDNWEPNPTLPVSVFLPPAPPQFHPPPVQAAAGQIVALQPAEEDSPFGVNIFVTDTSLLSIQEKDTEISVFATTMLRAFEPVRKTAPKRRRFECRSECRSECLSECRSVRRSERLAKRSGSSTIDNPISFPIIYKWPPMPELEPVPGECT